MSIAALYARVSTPTQEEEATIEAQVAAIEGYIQQHGYHLAQEHYFLDSAVSGARLDRPALDQLRHLAADHAFTVLVCYSPDRLARNYPHQWVVMDELQRHGVRVEFVNQPALGDNSHAQLLLGVQGLFAEYERAMIKERLRLGRLYKLRSGQSMPNTPPYGYHYLPASEAGGGRWVIDEREAAMVRQLFDWYTGPEHCTIRQITARLEEANRPLLRRGRHWQYSVVLGLLQQPAYLGRVYANRVRILPETVGTPRQTGRGLRKAAQSEARPAEEWIELHVPVLLERAVWEQAQERIAMNKRFAPRNNTRNFYLLRGLLVCGTCGYTLQGRTNGTRQYYACREGHAHRTTDVAAHTCHIAAHLLEPLVWQTIADLLADPARIAAAWEAEQAATDTTPDEVGRLQARLRKLEQQWVRVVDAFQEGLLEKEDLAQRKQQFDHARATLSARIAYLERHHAQQAAKAALMADFAQFCEQIQHALVDPTPETKREVLRLLVERIVVEEEEITIHHIIPSFENCRLRPFDLRVKTAHFVEHLTAFQG